MPGTVREVSATLVDRMIRRPVWEEKTRCCSCAERRAYSGTTSVWRSFAFSSASAVSRISCSPERKTRMSPSPTRPSSFTASRMPSIWSRSSSPSSPCSGR
jgi:hypothetical protein